MAEELIDVIEKYTSRAGGDGPRSTVEYVYGTAGSDDDDAVRAAVKNVAPIFRNGRVREDVYLDPHGAGIWEARVRYVPIGSATRTGSVSIRFNTTGGTRHTTQSIRTIKGYQSSIFGGTSGIEPPGYGGAIGVSADGVAGTNIIVPIFEWEETHYLSASSVTNAFMRNLYRMTARTNDQPFRDFSAGEVLFFGAAAGGRRSEDWEVTLRFAAFPNEDDAKVGDIIGIQKKGWEYLWARYEEYEDTTNKKLLRIPYEAFVEQVYHEGDYSTLGISTGTFEEVIDQGGEIEP